MLGNIIASLGSKIGGYLGGGILSSLGRYAGRVAGQYLEKKWFQRHHDSYQIKNLRESFYLVKANYGKAIPLIFGTMRVPGQIIWIDRIEEQQTCSNITKYFRAANVTNHNHLTECTYFASFAMALCEGEILEVKKIWYHNELVDLSDYKYRIYNGSEEQMPDPLIASKSEDGLAPGYRGLAYIVFENLPLAEFDHVIPNFSFEVTRKANIGSSNLVEDAVKSMVIIPGSGEFVYDTKIQSKQTANNSSLSPEEYINYHNDKNVADAVHSLDQLQTTCPNVDWVAPVVCWFGTNIEAGNCSILPAVEFKDENIQYSEQWQVGGYTRQTAYEISKDFENNPTYGGTVSDQSVLRYLRELRQRELKIMFYPMFFLDVEQKPWRGRVTGSAAEIRKFFNDPEGYNRFILHYAELVKEHVDAFIIGSELIGLTKVRDHGTYPAVDELVNLARMVKKIVGPKVKISYAADWSEYHHTTGGWFNLDKLWSCQYIDFIGIDAYFPVTDSISSVIDSEMIDKGWAQGEGFDYYIDGETQEKKALSPQYAWKNIKYWWENEHINPDGAKTTWLPRSKPIWFTEYGFPSIDKAPNQPNVFFDPKCLDGGVPKHSNGQIDFSIQRKAINSFIKYWSQEEYIEQMFLWTWDARPYPAWPHMNIWRDGYLWEKGHWVNDKFGNSNIAAIITEISQKSELDQSEICVSSIDNPVEGLIFSQQISAKNAINTLRVPYLFDINTHGTDKIFFTKRAYAPVSSISENSCLKLDDNSFFEETEIPESLKLSKLELYYIDHLGAYDKKHMAFNNEQSAYNDSALIRLPIALTAQEAENIGRLLLKNAQTESSILNFSIANTQHNLKPGNFIALHSTGKIYKLRIINIITKQLQSDIHAIIDQRELYFISYSEHNLEQTQHNFRPNNTTQLIIDILSSQTSSDVVNVMFNYVGPAVKPLFVKLAKDINWAQIMNLTPSSANIVQKFIQPHKANIFLIDESSSIIIQSTELKEGIYNWPKIRIGNEVIAYRYAQKLGPDLYALSHLIRGLEQSEEYMDTHRSGEVMSFVNKNKNLLEISKHLLNQMLNFKCGSNLVTTKLNEIVTKPVYITQIKNTDSGLYLKWVYRYSEDQEWESACMATRQTYQVRILLEQEVIFEQETDKTELFIEGFELSEEHKISIILNTAKVI